MNIGEFMSAYKEAWEQRDEHKLCALFTAEGVYHNTPFGEPHGTPAIAGY